MQEKYTAPELKLVGPAEEVILGSTGVGNDIAGQIQIPDLEFQED